MAKFDGDGDGKLDYQVLKPVFNIERMLKNFFQRYIAFLNGWIASKSPCCSLLQLWHIFRSSRCFSGTRRARIVLDLCINWPSIYYAFLNLRCILSFTIHCFNIVVCSIHEIQIRKRMLTIKCIVQCTEMKLLSINTRKAAIAPSCSIFPSVYLNEQSNSPY